MLDQIENNPGDVSTVVVLHFSRLSRSVEELYRVVDGFHNASVEVRSVYENSPWLKES